jgi:hypothetical protein
MLLGVLEVFLHTLGESADAKRVLRYINSFNLGLLDL